MNAAIRSATRTGLWLLPFLLTGCSSSYYVEYLVGDWAGTANEAKGQTLPMLASFDWDEEKAADEKNAFSGVVDIDGYLYNVNGVTSGADSADLHLTPQDPVRGEGDLTEVMLNDDEDAILGAFTMNVCPPGTNQDPNICVLSGDFELDMK